MENHLPANLETLVVRAWSDPLVEAHGYPVTSNYVETFWLPILGPSATWALRRLAGLAATPGGVRIPTAELPAASASAPAPAATRSSSAPSTAWCCSAWPAGKATPWPSAVSWRPCPPVTCCA